MPKESSLGEEASPEVFFRGKAMSTAVAPSQGLPSVDDDKENAKNETISPRLHSPMQSPSRGSASPASLFKKRPKPLEVLAAHNLMTHNNSPVASEARPHSRPRDSWVFSGSPQASAPLLNHETRAAKESSACQKPRESILAFDDLSPLAETPTAEAGLLGSKLFAKGLTSVIGPAPEKGQQKSDDQVDTSSQDSIVTAEQASHARAEEHGDSKKKRKESILWFNSNTGSRLCDINLQDAFADAPLFEEEDIVDTEPQVDRVSGDDTAVAAQTDEPDAVCTQIGERSDVGFAGGGVKANARVGGQEESGSTPARLSSGCVGASLKGSMLRPPSKSVTSGWGLSGMFGSLLAAQPAFAHGQDGDEEVADEDAVSEGEQDEAEEEAGEEGEGERVGRPQGMFGLPFPMVQVCVTARVPSSASVPVPVRIHSCLFINLVKHCLVLVDALDSSLLTSAR